MVNIPIIKYSVEWWNTLHQPATFKLTEKPSMPVEMWVPLLLSVLGLYLLFGWLACLRMKTEIVMREQKPLGERAGDGGGERLTDGV